MVWAAFLPQVQGFARVRSTRARPPVPFLDLGTMRYGRFEGPIPVLVSNYVCVATSKSEVLLASCLLVKSLTIFLLLKATGPSGGHSRWPHLRSDLLSR